MDLLLVLLANLLAKHTPTSGSIYIYLSGASSRTALHLPVVAHLWYLTYCHLRCNNHIRASALKWKHVHQGIGYFRAEKLGYRALSIEESWYGICTTSPKRTISFWGEKKSNSQQLLGNYATVYCSPKLEYVRQSPKRRETSFSVCSFQTFGVVFGVFGNKFRYDSVRDYHYECRRTGPISMKVNLSESLNLSHPRAWLTHI